MIKRDLIHRLVDALCDIHENKPDIQDAKRHFQSARLELLLGVRSLIDVALEGNQAISRKPTDGDAKTICVED